MFLINVTPIENKILPLLAEYTNDAGKYVLHNKTIYCDISGSEQSNNSYELSISLTLQNNETQHFNVMFRTNNNNNPKITSMKINNINIPILLNDRDPLNTSCKIYYQEFILTFDSGAGYYTAISTMRKYN
jgi:hypothetical protein